MGAEWAVGWALSTGRYWVPAGYAGQVARASSRPTSHLSFRSICCLTLSWFVVQSRPSQRALILFTLLHWHAIFQFVPMPSTHLIDVVRINRYLVLQNISTDISRAGRWDPSTIDILTPPPPPSLFPQLGLRSSCRSCLPHQSSSARQIVSS